MATNSSLVPVTETEIKNCTVFISYQWKIQSKVRILYQELASRDCLNVFMDMFKIKAGMNLYLTLASNIQQADVVLACVTREYVKSKNCEREIIYADAFNKHIIPLYMEKIPMAELGSIGFILVRERYCNLYRNGEKTFENFNESDEFKDILDGIKSSAAKNGISIELDKKETIDINLNDDSINNSVIQFRSDQPVSSSLVNSICEPVPEVEISKKFEQKVANKPSKKKESLPLDKIVKSSNPVKKAQKFTNVLEIHPIIKELKFLTTPKILLDPMGDRFNFENVEKKRGNEIYYPPVGWIRYGLNVKSIYSDLNKWLAKDGNPDEWAVCYHGFKSNPLRSYLYYKLCDKNGKLNPFFENSKNLKLVNVIDVNPKSLGFNTSCGIGIFCSPSAEKCEQHTATFVLNDIKYKMILQCRVNPQRIRIPKIDSSLFIINASNHIRPYGILIKEVE